MNDFYKEHDSGRLVHYEGVSIRSDLKHRISDMESQMYTPHTVQELENATHQEELPPARRTVVCIMGAVHGVGEIVSWGSDVEEKKNITLVEKKTFSFRFVLGSVHIR